jgi:hypothetical protein
MDINTLRQRRYTPRWGDNHKDKKNAWVIVFTPPTVGQFDSYRLAIEGKEDRVEAHASAGRSFIEASIVAHERLTKNGKAMDLDDALSFIMENRTLFNEVLDHFYGEATLTKAEGKK